MLWNPCMLHPESPVFFLNCRIMASPLHIITDGIKLSQCGSRLMLLVVVTTQIVILHNSSCASVWNIVQCCTLRVTVLYSTMFVYAEYIFFGSVTIRHVVRKAWIASSLRTRLMLSWHILTSVELRSLWSRRILISFYSAVIEYVYESRVFRTVELSLSLNNACHNTGCI